MNPATINSSSFTLMQGTVQVAGTVNLYGMTAIFNPLTDLAKDTTYTASLSTAVADMAGNRLAQNFSWTFTTGEIDTVTHSLSVRFQHLLRFSPSTRTTRLRPTPTCR